MRPQLAFWAKLGRTNVYPECYHPVLCHLIDVAQVARAIWNEVLREPLKRLIANAFGLTPDECGRWFTFWAGAHDIGKITPSFQAQGHSKNLWDRLKVAGFSEQFGENVHHGKTGTKILADELRRCGNVGDLPQSFFNTIGVAVGGHHGVFPPNWDLLSEVELGNTRWADARRDVLDALVSLLDVAKLPPPKPVATDDQSVWMFLAGLTSVADWIGSNQAFFASAGNAHVANDVLDINNYWKTSAAIAHQALDQLGWLGRSDFHAATFEDLFPNIKNRRPLQDKIIELAGKMTEPGLLIVEAPMGEGKTEAAWFVANRWDELRGQGTYVALPTMATSNQMFDRSGRVFEIRRWEEEPDAPARQGGA